MARPPPHLPFLSGPPQFAVGLRPIPLNAWLDPDTEAHTLGEKRALVAERLDDVFAETEGSAAAQQEAADLINAARAAPPVGFIETGLTLSDDLCIMEQREGAWSLTAALLCAPSFWSLRENIGGPLEHLHRPVPDRLGPDGAQGLPSRIARVFSALPPDQILERFNWTVQAGDRRFTPHAPSADISTPLHLRVERQTIRKLPQTGAVLFTIRVSLDPLHDVFAVEGAKPAFARAWMEAPDHVRAYKHWDVLDSYMRALLAA